MVNTNPLGSFSKATGTVDQRDRSLTVMIPRAKYHAPLPSKGSLVDVDGYKSKSSSQMSVNQSKLINYLDASPSPAKNKTVRIFDLIVKLKFINYLTSRMCHVKSQVINHLIQVLWYLLDSKFQLLVVATQVQAVAHKTITLNASIRLQAIKISTKWGASIMLCIK